MPVSKFSHRDLNFDFRQKYLCSVSFEALSYWHETFSPLGRSAVAAYNRNRPLLHFHARYSMGAVASIQCK